MTVSTAPASEAPAAALFGGKPAWRPRDSALPGLDRSSGLADRYRSWQGRSGRHYMFSVYSLRALKAELDPGFMFSDSVVILTEQARPGQRRIRSIGVSGRLPDVYFGALLADADEATEVHIHLLGRSREARAAIVADLRPN